MFKFLGVFTMSIILSSQVLAQPVSQQLPFPDKTGEATLMFALNKRQSVKEFQDKEIDDKVLGTILWAAYGANRTDGKRTIPTAMNQQDLEVYIAKKDGVFKYDGIKQNLTLVTKNDIRPLFQTQEYMKNVPVVLIYTGKNKEYAPMHAGSAYQNVELFAAANNLGSVVRGYFDKDEVKKALALTDEEYVIISQAVGYKAQ